MKLWPLMASLALTACAAQAAPPGIDAGRISAHVKVLSSDEFEGRAPASVGEIRSIAYLIGQYQALGLEPLGDRKPDGRRGWTQDVPLIRFENEGPVKSSLNLGGEDLALEQGKDVALRASASGAKHVAIVRAPLVFVGYGVTAPERGWDDFKGIDLQGKIALFLVNDPDFEAVSSDDSAGLFNGRAMTYYGRFRYKFEEAARRGALAALVIHETAPASYGWATVRNSNTNAVFDIVRAAPSRDHALLEGWIQRDRATELLQRAGLDLERLKVQARSRAFRPIPLEGVTFSADYAVTSTPVISRNVAGGLPGRTHPDEWVLYSAHWDHLGVGAPDARGDRIYNGAVDNATGVAVMLEIARSFQALPRPDRSVAFLALAAEEKGRLGAEYYMTRPLVPLPLTVADINMDSLRPTGPARDFAVAGTPPTTLLDDLRRVGEAAGRQLSPDASPEAGNFYRADHFSFAKAGVPAFSFESGRDLVEGGRAAGDAWSAKYVSDRYHQPADEFGPDWRSDGLAADAELLLQLGRDLAGSRVWPQWNAGAEFKAVRDATSDQRP